MEHEEAFGGDEFVHYLACGDAFTGIYICPNSSNVSMKYVAFCISIIPWWVVKKIKIKTEVGTKDGEAGT